jgi:hypothetical protein
MLQPSPCSCPRLQPALSPPAGGSIQLVELLDRSITDKMVAQAALQPGVGMVVRDVLRQGRDVVQLRWHCLDDPKPRPYADMRRSFGDAVVVGYVDSGSKRLHINPADKVQLLPGSRVLALTRQGALAGSCCSCCGCCGCACCLLLQLLWLRSHVAGCGVTVSMWRSCRRVHVSHIVFPASHGVHHHCVDTAWYGCSSSAWASPAACLLPQQ